MTHTRKAPSGKRMRAERESQPCAFDAAHTFRPLLEQEIRKAFFAGEAGAAPGRPSATDRSGVSSGLIADLADCVLGGGCIEQASELMFSETDAATRLMIIEAVVRELGTRWECDQTDFALVSLCVARLQAVVRRIGRESSAHRARHDTNHSVLITAPAGEAHTFPLSVVEQHFAAAGWHCDVCADGSHATIREVLRRGDHQAVCMCWCDSRLSARAHALASLIAGSIDSEKTVFMAGGAAANACVNTLASSGVDKVCSDTYSGVRFADAFVRGRDRIARGQHESSLMNAIRMSPAEWTTE